MDIFSEAFIQLAMTENREPGDYTDEQGLLVCGKCRTRKQYIIALPWNGENHAVPIACKCGKRTYEQFLRDQERRQFKMRMDALQQDGLTDPEYRKYTFDGDDYAHRDISDACRKYVDNWDKMREKGIGLLLYGGVGTGKSFMACCIANALIEKNTATLVTSFPRILNRLQSLANPAERGVIFDRLRLYDLVVIDDLGAERGTEYALEQVYAVIDAISRSKKPLIVTTNLTPVEVKTPANIGYERIYDRILERCHPVKMTGESRRTEAAERNREFCRAILGA